METINDWFNVATNRLSNELIEDKLKRFPQEIANQIAELPMQEKKNISKYYEAILTLFR